MLGYSLENSFWLENVDNLIIPKGFSLYKRLSIIYQTHVNDSETLFVSHFNTKHGLITLRLQHPHSQNAQRYESIDSGRPKLLMFLPTLMIPIRPFFRFAAMYALTKVPRPELSILLTPLKLMRSVDVLEASICETKFFFQLDAAFPMIFPFGSQVGSRLSVAL